MPIGFAISGYVLQPFCHATISHSIIGIALNAAQRKAPLDIKMAMREGFVIADASGIVGVNPATPGQRDASATLVRDSDGFIAK